MDIFLLRHSLTEWNEEGKMLGKTDLDLTKQGIILAKETTKRLSKKDLSFDIILSSEMKRTYQTAQIINNFYHLPIRIDRRLNERAQGALEGMGINELNERCSEINFATPLVGRESILTFTKRVIEVFDEIAKFDEYEKILVVGHSGVFRLFMAYKIKIRINVIY